MARTRKGFVRLVVLCLATVVLLASQEAWTIAEGPFRSTALNGFARGGNKAQAVASNSLYLPFLSKTYALGPSVLGVELGNADDEAKGRLVADSGAKWTRVALEWSRIEPSNTTPDNYTWSEYDQVFARVARWGLSPIVVVTGNPSWAADTTCGPANRTIPQEFAQFLTAVVGRYGGLPYGFKYWELYNEPDNSDSANHAWLGGCWGNNGREYGQMLQAAYPAIKAADPQAKVVFGSLAYDGFSDNMGGIFIRGFIDDALDPQKGNAGPYFDVFGFHFYYLFRMFWEPYGRDLIGKTNVLRSKLAYYGLTKPMILTEVGMPSGTVGAFQGSDDLQGNYVVQSYVRSMSAGITISIWFSLMDFDNSRLGLVNTDLSPKQSYQVYRALATYMSGAEYNRALDGTAYPGVEGYVFTVPGGSREKWVLWASGDNPTTITLLGVRARLIDKLGQPSYVDDGDDGNWDGRLNVRITPNPIYLEVIS